MVGRQRQENLGRGSEGFGRNQVDTKAVDGVTSFQDSKVIFTLHEPKHGD